MPFTILALAVAVAYQPRPSSAKRCLVPISADRPSPQALSPYSYTSQCSQSAAPTPIHSKILNGKSDFRCPPAALIALHRSYTRRGHEQLASQSRGATYKRLSGNISQKSPLSLEKILWRNTDGPPKHDVYPAPRQSPSEALTHPSSSAHRVASVPSLPPIHVITGYAFMGITYLGEPAHFLDSGASPQNAPNVTKRHPYFAWASTSLHSTLILSLNQYQ